MYLCQVLIASLTCFYEYYNGLYKGGFSYNFNNEKRILMNLFGCVNVRKALYCEHIFRGISF